MTDGERGEARLALLYTLPEGRPIWGVTSLGDELFVAREKASHIEVYRYSTLYRRLEVPGLANARDLAACHVHACLYITDVGNKGDDSKTEPRRPYAVHRSVCLRSAHFPLDISPGHFPQTFRLPDNFPSLVTWCRTFPFHRHPPIYNIKRSIVNVYKIDGGRSVSVRKWVIVPVFKFSL